MQKIICQAAVALGVLTTCAHAGITSAIGAPLPLPQTGRQLFAAVPEPSSPILLGIDLLSVAAIVFLLCRREFSRHR